MSTPRCGCCQRHLTKHSKFVGDVIQEACGFAPFAGELGACPLVHQAFQKPPARQRLPKGLVPEQTGTQLPPFDGPRRDVSSLPQRPLLFRSTAMAQPLSSHSR
ncbi:hypothetical protein QTO34_002742 [Cnephaeus nilssonii]|uniref:Uncharacterized protein n=1 Tax=Cnephaeus nilssonii TaxID=3371016 RepID=A0AA40LLN5_CNENI|nr:hypothetical protein QTO34_002742 [Eptesicus nilssonii]